MLLAAGSRDPDTGDATEQFVDMLVLHVGYRVGIQPVDIAGMQEQRLPAPLARDNEFGDRLVRAGSLCHGRRRRQ